MLKIILFLDAGWMSGIPWETLFNIRSKDVNWWLHKLFSQKVIIVDDGSKDTTTAVGLDYVEKFGCDKVKLLHTDNDLTNSCHAFTIIAFFTRCVCWPLIKIGARVGQSEWECSEQGSKNIEMIGFRLCLPIAPLYQTRLKMERVLNLSPFFQGRKSALCWCWWRYNLCWPDQARGCNEGHFCRRRGNVSQFFSYTDTHTRLPLL